MGRTLTLLRLGVKYLYCYRRRYIFLMAALVFSFAMVTLITSLKDGMRSNLYHTAQLHYSGDIVAMGYASHSVQMHRLGQAELAALHEAVKVADIRPSRTVLRTLHFQTGIAHFNGATVLLRYLTGCDWDEERELFSRMTFDETPDLFPGDDGIFLSKATAQILGALMGDSIILEVETQYGQKNTQAFIVKGIIHDTSIFGYYKAYISRLSLNRLMLFDDDDASVLGLFFENESTDAQTINRKRARLHEALEGRVQLHPLVNNREEFAKERRPPSSGIAISLYTLAVYLSEVSNLLAAMNIMTYFLYGIMLVIILVSASVTYRLILYERTQELGTMRAIGFYGKDLRLVLWAEIAGVGAISLVLGFALALALSWGISHLSFAWFPSFEIFMRNGKLTALYLTGTVLVNMAAVFLLLAVAVLFPSFRASRKNLPALLRGEPL